MWFRKSAIELSKRCKIRNQTKPGKNRNPPCTIQSHTSRLIHIHYYQTNLPFKCINSDMKTNTTNPKAYRPDLKPDNDKCTRLHECTQPIFFSTKSSNEHL
jgi:hypothetical protein